MTSHRIKSYKTGKALLEGSYLGVVSEKILIHPELFDVITQVSFLEADITKEMRRAQTKEEQNRAYLKLEDLYRQIDPLLKEVGRLTTAVEAEFPEEVHNLWKELTLILEGLKLKLQTFIP